MASTVCGNTVALATFLSWNATDIGYKTAENVPGRAVVSSVWCKVCAKYIDNVKSDNCIRGKALSNWIFTLWAQMMSPNTMREDIYLPR